MRILYTEYFILVLSLATSVSLKMQEVEPSKKTSCILTIRKKFNVDFTKTYIWLFAFVVLCVLFLFLYYMADLHKNHGDEDELMRRFMRSTNETQLNHSTITSTCSNFNCKLVCANSSNFNEDFLGAIQESSCSTIELFHIERQMFPNQTLEKGWIKNVTTFSELVITNSFLTTIKNEAFNNEPFTETYSVTFRGLPITKLSAGALLGLSKLEHLSIECELVLIDRGFFQPVSASLRYLRLNHLTDSIRFDRIFGISEMINVVHLDLSSNNFGNSITMQGFRRLYKVKYINLSNCKIYSIDEDAFEPIAATLESLDLSFNLLKTLKPNTFNSILSNGVGSIYLRENHWSCDCSLQTLVDYLENYTERFADRPYCRSPRKLYGTNIDDNIFCQKETTTVDGISKQSTTDTQTEQTSPVIPPIVPTSGEQAEATYTSEIILPTTSSNKRKLVKLSCAYQKEVKQSFYTTSDFDYLSLLPPLHNFSIHLVNRSTVKIIIEELKSHLSILWHSDSDEPNSIDIPEPEYGCQTLLNKSIIIGNLKDNVSYTFCLISEGETTVTPFNCQPFHIPSAKSSETKGWITNDQKQIVLAIIVIILLASTCTGSVISYFVIKNYPDLLQGSKHVVIVKKSTIPTISTISTKDNLLHEYTPEPYRKKLTPLPSYQSEVTSPDVESNYENPDDIQGYETPRRHTYSFDRCVFMDVSPKSPPPLPKRNSEPTSNIMEQIYQYQTRI